MTSPRACPFCKRPLVPIDHRGVAVEACPERHGLLVPQASLSALLDAMSADLLTAYDPDAELAPNTDRGEPTDCPSCGHRMEVDDYCRANLVLFDRCPTCHHLWLEPGKLGKMTLIWARMEARIARVRAATAVLEKDLASFVSLVILNRRPAGL